MPDGPAPLRTAPLAGRQRIVHLLDPRHAGEEACLACMAACRDAEAWQDVWLIGDSEDERTLEAIGLRVDCRIGLHRALPELGVRPLRRLLDDRKRAGLGPDVIHCWSVEGLSLARAAFGREVPRTGLLCHGPARGRGSGIDEPRVNAAFEGVLLATFSREIAALWAPLHVTMGAVLDRPDPPLPEWEQDRVLSRAALDIAPDETAVMLLADPASNADAKQFTVMLGTLRLGGSRVIGMAPMGAMQARRAARYMKAFGRVFEVTTWAGPAVRALPAADIVLWGLDPALAATVEGRSLGGSLLASIASARGLPVIAMDHPLSREVLGAAPACLCDSLLFVDVSRTLLPWALDRAVAHAAAGPAVKANRNALAASAFGAQIGILWQRAAGMASRDLGAMAGAL